MNYELLPIFPYKLLLILFITVTVLTNLSGSKPLAQLGLIMLFIGEIVIITGFAIWLYGVHFNQVGVGKIFSLMSFHFKSFGALTAATAIAILSYLAFDATTTLAEEAKNPKRDIPRAIFLSLFIGSLTMFLTGYIGMLVIPNWQAYIHNNAFLNTALFFCNKKTGENMV